MIELNGEFLELPTPNKPGCWVYRKLPDDTLLEVELSWEEWHALHEHWRQAKQARIRDLNEHALNRAAKTLLDQASGHDPSNMALLELAFHTLVAEGRTDGDETMQTVAQWMSDPSQCRHALATLEGDEGTTESDLKGKTPKEAGRMILALLGFDD